MKSYEELLAERDAAMREASELAMCIWRSEFRNESPEFELCDSPAGVITQIDNMFAGIRQQRDAFAAQVAILKAAYGNLADVVNKLDETNDTDSEEIIEEMWGRALSVMQDGWNSFSRKPQQCLAEIRAEAGRDGFLEGVRQMCDNEIGMLGHDTESCANHYAARVRLGFETGTWLKDSNVNGGKRQGVEK